MAKSGMFGSSPGPEEKSRTWQTYKSPTQMKYIEEALNLYGPTLGKGMDVYQGPRVAPFAPLQKGVFDFAEQGGLMMTPEQASKTWATIQEPHKYEFWQEYLPQYAGQFSGPGYWGSPVAEAKGREILKFGQEQRAGREKFMLWNLEQNRQAALQQFGLGTVQQQQEQAEIAADMQKFAEQSQITDPTNLAILMSLLGMSVVSSGVSRSQVTQPSWHTGDWLEFAAKTAPAILSGGSSGLLSGLEDLAFYGV